MKIEVFLLYLATWSVVALNAMRSHFFAVVLAAAVITIPLAGCRRTETPDRSSSFPAATPAHRTVSEPGDVKTPDLAPAKSSSHERQAENSPSETPTLFQRQRGAEQLGYDAVGKGTAAAVGQLSQLTDFAARRAFLRGMYLRLAEGDAHSALDAVKLKGLSAADSEFALRTLVEAWQTGPVDSTISREMDVRFGSRASILAPLLSGPSPNYALALEAGRAVVGDRQWVDFLSLVAAQQAQTDPRAALELGAGLAGKTQTYFLGKMTAGWAATDPEGAFAWATQISDPDVRAQLQSSTLSSWVRSDPAASATRLAQLPPGAARDQAIRDIGVSWGALDTQAALAWAGGLPDATQQQQAIAAIRTSAPVGIGLVLQSGSEGDYPLVGDTVPGGATAEIGAIAKGDRIAAVSDASGNMIDVRGKALNEVVSMIRGAPGTTVQIAVLPADASDPNARRIVYVARRQLLMKQ